MSPNRSTRTPLRLWPGLVAAALLVVLRYLLPAVQPETLFIGMMAGLGATLVILSWWLFFSRAPWLERLGAVVLMAAAVWLARPLLDPSIATAGQSMLYPILIIPVLAVGLVVSAAASSRFGARGRWASLVVTIALVCGAFIALRTSGIFGGAPELHLRWSETAEERALAQAPLPSSTLATPAGPAMSEPGDGRVEPAMSEPGLTPAGPAMSEPGIRRVEWTGFRGPDRDGVIRGVQIETDWAASPPVELWRHPVGPGWSSFSVAGDRIYTQEQRADHEVVASYRLSTGEPVWHHRDAVRFWESNGGAGPRGTPTLHDGRVYAFGATGILNALDAATGVRFWARDVAAETATKVPMWGFASSPLVVGDTVIVAAAGKLAAYDAATGGPRWRGPLHPGGYSSPHLAVLDGVPQVLLLTADGVSSVEPATGTVLWEHEWTEGIPIVQPAVTGDGDVLINEISATAGLGIRRLSVANAAAGWTVEERWTSRGLKPYFNDFVVHEGHAYGFDGSILSCIDLTDGERAWKGGRYGNGQMVLLADQDLLLVISEEGELALVRATPDAFTEVARFQALDGKTWNHPVIVGDVLLVRNGEEMAAFRLPGAMARR